MTGLQECWLILASTWVGLELIIIYKTRRSTDESVQRGYKSEKLIWWVVLFSLIAAFGFKQLQLSQIPINYGNRQIIALFLFTIGLMIRFSAIITLGRFFSTKAVIQPEHLLINHGLYHYIRHPAYTGLVLSFFAAGIAMGDFLALLVLVLPLLYVLKKRISVEEVILIRYFGKDYLDYAVRTKKLIPWLY